MLSSAGQYNILQFTLTYLSNRYLTSISGLQYINILYISLILPLTLTLTLAVRIDIYLSS